MEPVSQEGFTQWNPASPFVRRLNEFGPIYHRKDDQVVALQIGSNHTNMYSMAHGGLLATLIDCALGNAIVIRLEIAVVTVQMSISYLKAVHEGDWLEAHTRIDRKGRRLVYATCTLQVETTEITQASAVFTIRN